jgi:hypothetical protein
MFCKHRSLDRINMQHFRQTKSFMMQHHNTDSYNQLGRTFIALHQHHPLEIQEVEGTQEEATTMPEECLLIHTVIQDLEKDPIFL